MSPSHLFYLLMISGGSLIVGSALFLFPVYLLFSFITGTFLWSDLVTYLVTASFATAFYLLAMRGA